MKCLKAKALIPAFSDKELEDREYNEVKSHLSCCSSCSTELKEWQKIQLIMRDIRTLEIAAPPGLQGAVLSQLSREKTWAQEIPAEKFTPKTVPAASIFNFINMFSTRIKRGVAAAAAVILMGTAAGGLWLQSEVNIAGIDSNTKLPITQDVPAEHRPEVNASETETQGATVETTSDEKDSATIREDTPEKSVNGTEIDRSVNDHPNDTAPSSSTDGQSEIPKSNSTDPQPKQTNTGESSDVVLLKMEKIIHSGHIKINDTNLVILHETATAVAHEHGAIFTVQMLEQTENGASREMVKFTVAKDNFNSLYNDLLAIGPVVDKGLADDNISDRYSKTEAQLLELKAQKQQSGQTSDQQKETQEKIASLEDQLRRWDQAVKTGTIALWLEGIPG